MSSGTGSPSISLKREGDKLTGEYSGLFGESKITGKINGHDVSWTFTGSYDGQEVTCDYTGTLVGFDQMKGTCLINGQYEATWTAKK